MTAEREDFGVSGDQHLCIAVHRLAQYGRVVGIHGCRNGARGLDQVCGLVGNEAEDGDRIPCRKLHLLPQCFFQFVQDATAENQLVIQQHQLEHIDAEAACREGADQDIGVEEYPQDTT